MDGKGNNVVGMLGQQLGGFHCSGRAVPTLMGREVFHQDALNVGPQGFKRRGLGRVARRNDPNDGIVEGVAGGHAQAHEGHDAEGESKVQIHWCRRILLEVVGPTFMWRTYAPMFR